MTGNCSTGAVSVARTACENTWSASCNFQCLTASTPQTTVPGFSNPVVGFGPPGDDLSTCVAAGHVFNPVSCTFSCTTPAGQQATTSTGTWTATGATTGWGLAIQDFNIRSYTQWLEIDTGVRAATYYDYQLVEVNYSLAAITAISPRSGDLTSTACKSLGHTWTPGPMADCVGAWSSFGACSTTCGNGTQTRIFLVSVFPFNGGVDCVAQNGTAETQSCSTQACPAPAPAPAGNGAPRLMTTAAAATLAASAIVL